MQALLDVILPVFLVIGFGYVTVWVGFFGDSAIDALIRFTQQFAFPCLLFLAMARLDLSASFDPALIGSFYTGALASFFIGLFAARSVFKRDWDAAIAIGFTAMYSNGMILGVPITERAYGPEALTANFAIIAVHTPVCYAIGLTLMELVRAEGKGAVAKARSISRAIFRNALIVGIGLGILVNLSGLPIPGVLTDALNLVSLSALPAALFSLGGVLYRYRPEGDAWTIAMVCGLSLILHPLIALALGTVTGLSTEHLRSAVVTAAMAPGVNGYIFASLYGVGMRVAASSVLVGTVLSILTAWVWLSLLP